jgi:hypothetical protein
MLLAVRAGKAAADCAGDRARGAERGTTGHAARYGSADSARPASSARRLELLVGQRAGLLAALLREGFQRGFMLLGRHLLLIFSHCLLR